MDEKRNIYDEEAPQAIRRAPSHVKKIALSGALLLVGTWALLGGDIIKSCTHHRVSGPVGQPLTVQERAQNILSQTPLIDGHNDLPILVRGLYNNKIYGKNFTEPFKNGGFAGHVDLPRLREGQNGGAFWSVYTPCPANGSDFSDENYAESVQWTLDQIDVITRIKQAFPDDFSPNLNSDTALAAFAKGQLVSPLGVEGLHQIGNRVTNLRQYHALGVRYATLTHNCHNKFADAALLESPFRKAEPLWHGLSPDGRRLIEEYNRIGLIVDLSHTSEETQIDVLGGKDWSGTKAPVIYSHSSAFSVCPHPRNVKDHVLDLVKKNNGVVMVNFAPDFISCVDTGKENGVPEFYPQNSTIHQVVRHVIHIGNQIGFEHVGFGSDFDGIGSVPKGLEDVSKYPDLVAELLKQGLSDEDAAKVVGGNVLRVWKDVEDVAAKLQKEGTPVLEDEIPPRSK
ncbi:Dipeptidase sirJ [Colletotrichum orbiculare MAFF 240422]|uniref:Dipeptidase n=1 Tax=Colletotrichum orbiculare (strain 104-T / ATCC 96160 / CBS 514.97 / LARS 414 / MAFF 240422) TaxID=1213857 RepID=N4V508_COLOR|nr:Dipeptidase sirJ [Colletotrichum orbiculare MAFF 240422]